jgi:hypothetical protein
MWPMCGTYIATLVGLAQRNGLDILAHLKIYHTKEPNRTADRNIKNKRVNTIISMIYIVIATIVKCRLANHTNF